MYKPLLMANSAELIYDALYHGLWYILVSIFHVHTMWSSQVKK